MRHIVVPAMVQNRYAFFFPFNFDACSSMQVQVQCLTDRKYYRSVYQKTLINTQNGNLFMKVDAYEYVNAESFQIQLIELIN